MIELYLMKYAIRFVGFIHKHLVFSRRTEVLSQRIAQLLPEQCSVLDIGCGDGLVAQKIIDKKPGVMITGIDVLARKKSYIPVALFDGVSIPYPDNSFDCTILIDVLHHTTKQDELLQEATRVAKRYVIIKDHYADFRLKHWFLSILDWVGNKPHGVPLPFAFLSRAQWNNLWSKTRLKKETEILRIDLYPFPLNRLIDWPWNFIVRLKKT